MRVTITSALFALMALSACSSSNGGPNNDNDAARVCAEQSAWAEMGRTDGRDIRITCP